MAAKVKKGDRVIVIAGRDKGKTGQVLSVNTDNGRVVVQGVSVRKRHTKPTQADPQGGIKMFEAAIDVSNVAHIDPADGKAVRVGFKFDEKDPSGKRKIRYAKRSGEAIDV